VLHKKPIPFTQTSSAVCPGNMTALTSFMSQMIASKPGCSPKMTIICDNARILPDKEVPMKGRPAYLRSQSIPDFSPERRSSRWQSLTTSNDLKERPNQGKSPSLTMPRRNPSRLQGESTSPTMPMRKPSLTSMDYSSMLDDDLSPRLVSVSPSLIA
jgi:hypothetical protein